MSPDELGAVAAEVSSMDCPDCDATAVPVAVDVDGMKTLVLVDCALEALVGDDSALLTTGVLSMGVAIDAAKKESVAAEVIGELDEIVAEGDEPSPLTICATGPAAPVATLGAKIFCELNPALGAAIVFA
jgi:hypothetical protein